MIAFKVCYVNDGSLASINHLVELKYEIGVEVKAPVGSALFLFATFQDAIRAASCYRFDFKIFAVEYTPTNLDIRKTPDKRTILPWKISCTDYPECKHYIESVDYQADFPSGTIFADSVTLLEEISR